MSTMFEKIEDVTQRVDEHSPYKITQTKIGRALLVHLQKYPDVIKEEFHAMQQPQSEDL